MIVFITLGNVIFNSLVCPFSIKMCMILAFSKLNEPLILYFGVQILNLVFEI